jgi:hypothetical protein
MTTRKNTNFGRLLGLYVVSTISLSLVIFLIILFAIYIPAIRETSDASSPGLGIWLLFWGQVSCIAGFVGAVPFTFILNRFLKR